MRESAPATMPVPPKHTRVDALVFSSSMAAAVAAVLSWAAGLSLGTVPRWQLLALAGLGTFTVYNIDRILDRQRDLAHAPLRSAFVDRHRVGILALVGFAGAGSLVLAAHLEKRIWIVCALVFGLGLLHRRLKTNLVRKILYITFAWVAVTVGLPLLDGGAAALLGGIWCGFVIGSAIASNLILCNLDRHPTAKPSWRTGAIAVALVGCIAGLAGPAPTLALIPGCEAVAIAGYRGGERYLLWVIDGALLVGGLLAVVAIQIL